MKLADRSKQREPQPSARPLSPGAAGVSNRSWSPPTLAEELSDILFTCQVSQGTPLAFMINGQTTDTQSWQGKLCSPACDLSSSSDPLWQFAQEWERGQEQQQSFSLHCGSTLQHIHNTLCVAGMICAYPSWDTDGTAIGLPHCRPTVPSSCCLLQAPGISLWAGSSFETSSWNKQCFH